MPTQTFKKGSSTKIKRSHRLNAPKTPQELGYRMPAEWERHEATWFSWPHNEETFPEHLHDAQFTIARCIKEITKETAASLSEHVNLIVRNETDRKQAQAALDFWAISPDAYSFYELANNDVWIRDYGPLFISRPKEEASNPLAGVSFRFDGWGGKDETYYGSSAGADDRIARSICDALNLPCFDADIVLEGGAIDGNGQGTCLTTKNCLLDRAAGPSQEEWEKHLYDNLGFEKVLWLEGANFDGDDTEGHVDNLTRFVGPHEVVTMLTSDKNDPWYEPLQANLKQLHSMRDADGRQLDIIPIELPAPFYLNAILDGVRGRRRYPASYANFIIGNSVVLVPTYADANDLKALDALSMCFPERDIIPIDCSRYILGQGALHCSSQQQPAR